MIRDRRGVSEVVGAALIFGVIITLSLSILLVSTQTINTAEAQSEFDSAQQIMTEFDSQAGLTALEYHNQANSQDLTEIENNMEVVEDTGWIRVRVTTPENGETVVMNETFNSVIYTNDGVDGEIAYEGGGVWKKTHGNVQMVSPPEFHFRGKTITIPMVNVAADSEIGDGDVTIKKTGSERIYPDPDDPTLTVDGEADPNPIKAGEVNITVQSEYYEAWGTFFEDRTQAETTYDHENNRVHATLKIPLEYSVDAAIAAKASGERMEIGNNMEIAAYNSTEGPPRVSESDDARLSIASELVVDNNAKVKGSVVTNGFVNVKKGTITGNVYCPDPDNCAETGRNGDIKGDIIQEDVEIEAPSAEGLINSRTDDYKSDNDNNETSTIQNDRLSGGGPYELDSGTYYLEELNLNGETLVLDTSDGDVDIAVDGDVQVNGGKIKVKGDGRAEMYVSGTDWDFDNGATVKTASGDRNSTRIWFYGKPGTDVTFAQGGTTFVGVVYAPSDESRTTTISINQKVEIYGGLIGYVDNIGQNVALHFDEALLNSKAFPEEEEVTYVTYLHLSTNEVTVDDGDDE